MNMPFGKHKGMPLEELPDDYLVWLSDRDNLYPPLRAAVDRECDMRWGGTWQQQQQAPPPPIEPKMSAAFTGQEGVLFAELLRAGFRALALKYHPDQGGDTEAMRQLNALQEKVKKLTWGVNGKK